MYNVYLKHKLTDKIFVVDITDKNIMNSEIELIVTRPSKGIWKIQSKDKEILSKAIVETKYKYRVNELFYHEDFEVLDKITNFNTFEIKEILNYICRTQDIYDDRYYKLKDYFTNANKISEYLESNESIQIPIYKTKEGEYQCMRIRLYI